MSYQIILFADTPSSEWLARGYGAYRLASELRDQGYTVLTVDFSSTLVWDKYKELIDLAVGDDTLCVGFSTTWFPYRNLNYRNPRYAVGPKSTKQNSRIDFDPEQHAWYYDSLSFSFAMEGPDKWANYVRSKNPKTKVIVGGAKASEYALEKAVDNVFIGHSETMLPDYLENFTRKSGKKIFNKVIDWDVKAQDASFDFRKSSTKYVPTDIMLKHDLGNMEFTRGCIFNCTFCSYPHRNQKTKEYLKYKEVLRAEFMDNYEKWGITKYNIIDDTFNDSVEKLEVIKEVIESLPFKPKFWAYCRMDLFYKHPEMIQLMKDIGVAEIFYGLETWHPKTAKAIGKGGSNEMKIECMRRAREVWGDDVYVTVGIIMGLPYDTVESVEDAVNWFLKEGKDLVHWFNINAVTLYPPTATTDLRSLSDIERYPDKWGYYWPDAENDPLEWVKTDGSNIKTKSQADELMIKYQEMLYPLQSRRRNHWWYSLHAASNPKLDFDYLRSCTDDEFDEAFRDYRPTDMFWHHVNHHYWPQLFAILQASKAQT